MRDWKNLGFGETHPLIGKLNFALVKPTLSLVNRVLNLEALVLVECLLNFHGVGGSGFGETHPGVGELRPEFGGFGFAGMPPKFPGYEGATLALQTCCREKLEKSWFW